MLEDLSAIQSRISEIQSRIAALSPAPPAPPPTAESGNPAQAPFSESLQRAQTGDSQSGITVTPASLGPLPPLPIAPGATQLVPIPHSGTAQYDGLIQTYAEKHNLDPALVKAVMQTESGGNPRAVSRAGAMGLMQLMPSNVKEAGISNPFDPAQNIDAGAAQLSGLLAKYGGDIDLALAGYNAGPGNVSKYGGVPPFRETQTYIRKVRAAMERDKA